MIHPMMIGFNKFLCRTLHKIFIYVEAQQDGNKIQRLFRSNEKNNLLKDCNAELDQAKKVFEVRFLLFFVTELNTLCQVGTGGSLFKNIEEMKRATQTKHKEILELISTMSETNTTADGSSVCHLYSLDVN